MNLAVQSTLKVLGISAIIALICYLLTQSIVVSICGLILTMVLQYVLFTFIRVLISDYYIVKLREKQITTLEPLSSILECAYCKEPNVVTFMPNDNRKIEFDCMSCQKKNSVSIQIVVAQITEHVKGTSLLPVDEPAFPEPLKIRENL